MIDHDDAESVSDLILVAPNLGCLLLALALAVLVYCIAASNEQECERTTRCPAGSELRLQDHACECVAPGVPR